MRKGKTDDALVFFLCDRCGVKMGDVEDERF